jgi:hypothetical protein
MPGTALGTVPMLMLAAAALATNPPEPRPAAIAEASVTIRIVSGVRLKLDGSPNPGAPAARGSIIKARDGTSHPAKLIEFQ